MMIKALIPLLMTLQLMAAIPAQKPVGATRQIGGQAGSGFSLLKIQRMANQKKGIERLVFHIGTKEGYLLKGLPGYFNVQNKGQKIVIDFAQMPLSKINEKLLKEILKSSNLITGSKIIKDPIDQTLTLSLNLKQKSKMKIIQVKGEKETARLVLDIIKK